MNQKKIGKFIFEMRIKKGFSQEQLSKMIPVSRQAVSSWKLGKSIPDIAILLKLGKIFGVSIDELLFVTDYPSYEVANKWSLLVLISWFYIKNLSIRLGEYFKKNLYFL